MSAQQLALWDESAALRTVKWDKASEDSRAREAFSICTRLVTIDQRAFENTMTAAEYDVALDHLVSRASNLFVIGRDDQYFEDAP